MSQRLRRRVHAGLSARAAIGAAALGVLCLVLAVIYVAVLLRGEYRALFPIVIFGGLASFFRWLVRQLWTDRGE